MLPFNASKPFTIGIELEIQIIDRKEKDLISSSIEILESLTNKPYSHFIKPEITKSMLEINSGVHETATTLLQELESIKNQLIEQTKGLNIFFSGGGTHPFQMWQERETYPTSHYANVEKKYGYLAKVFTVFGLHLHIGCACPNDALYLTQAIAKYVPHFIALSASSPFCQGIDTQFFSSRSNTANLFPMSGMPPFILEWGNFSDYLKKIKRIPLIDTINDFYWDIRPKAEFGTVEIRVCDSPLAIEKVAQLAAFSQALACYLLKEKPHSLHNDTFGLYRYNRFQASKWGFDAHLIDPENFQEYSLHNDLLSICKKIEPHAQSFQNEKLLQSLVTDITAKNNDAKWLRKLFFDGENLKDIVYLAGHVFSEKINLRLPQKRSFH